MKTFQDKVVVVTGAGNGIGRSLATLLAQQGARLALTSKTPENLAETVRSLDIAEEKLFSRAFDISDKAQVFEFAEQVQSHFGQVDGLINNAGVAMGGLTFEELEVEDSEWIFSINYMGLIYATKAFLPLLKQNPAGGTIVNMSSLFGLVPMALKTPYCSTKYAITGFTDCLRMELESTSVLVVGVYPGGVKTGVTLNARKADREPDYAREFDKKLTMQPEKAAQMILNGIRKQKDQVIIGNDARLAIFAQRNLPFLIRRVARQTMQRFKS